METLKQRREKLIEERINEKLIKETEEYLVKYGGISFEKEDNKGCWLFPLMFVVFCIIYVLLMFLTRG